MNAFRFCLDRAGVRIHEIDRLACYENPTAKLARRLWTTLPDLAHNPTSALFRLDADRPLREIRELLGPNGVLRTRGSFEEIFVQPAAGGAGGAFGAAALVHHRHTGRFPGAGSWTPASATPRTRRAYGACSTAPGLR
ncbi:hypothetical protein ACFVOK_13950 [Streptomyces sp. NPDC057798]|uniref:hypothetical protein n=1 Tax=Streptomyces sp. NPDC057798 TaxID=3346252 RepID=UPI0036981719